MKKLTLLKSLLLAIGLLAGNLAINAETKTYTLITSNSQLEVGAKYLVVGIKSSDDCYAMGLQNTNNRVAVSVTISSNSISTEPATSNTDTKPFEITLGGSTDNWTLYDPLNNGYLYAASSSSNYLKTQATSTTWKITIAIDGKASMTSNTGVTRNILRFNSSNNPPLFACYSTGQNDVYLYKLQTSSNPAATPTFSPAAGTYTSAQNVTISCTTEGASIYYTTDGSDPDNTKTPYTGAISVTSTTTIKAIAYASGYDPSAIASATYTINVAPTITVTEVTLPAFSATAGSNQNQNITVNGTNLTDNITLALSGTDADVFSLSESSITPTAGSVTDKVITITYAPTAPGSHSAMLTLSSSGATDVTRDLTGTATLAKPTVNTASNIGKTALTLNWNAVTGATSYEVNVYTKTTGTVTATDLFISEYVEGSSNNKALEIFNGTGADVDLSQYSLKKQTNGAGKYKDEKSLSGTLANGDVYVIANSSASDAIKAKADLTENLITAFNGNDAIGLFKNGTQIDEVGVFNQPADWGKDVTLVRKSTVTSPKVPYDANDWNSLATDYIDNLGSHTMDGFGTINNPVSGSPFTTTETSLQVSGLTAATTYYYTVTAKNGSYVSSASDEASASTLGTATSNVAVRGIFVRNGQVVVTAPAAGERIEIFNAVGQRLVSKLSTEGENTISVSAKGVLVVKFGSGVTKVIVP